MPSCVNCLYNQTVVINLSLTLVLTNDCVFMKAIPTLLIGIFLQGYESLTWPFWLHVGFVAVVPLTEGAFYVHAILYKYRRDSMR